MSYNPLIDIAILGAFLVAVGAIMYVTRPIKTGAEPMSRKEIEAMQKVRRAENALE